MATKNAPRVMITVNGEETLLTNALMMERAIAALREVGECAEVIAKAEQHLAQLTKKGNAPKTKSRVAIENGKLADQVFAIMPDDEPVLTSWVMNHVRGIMTPQKCTKVMQVLLDRGVVEKVAKVEGRYTGYRKVA